MDKVRIAWHGGKEFALPDALAAIGIEIRGDLRYGTRARDKFSRAAYWLPLVEARKVGDGDGDWRVLDAGILEWMSDCISQRCIKPNGKPFAFAPSGIKRAARYWVMPNEGNMFDFPAHRNVSPASVSDVSTHSGLLYVCQAIMDNRKAIETGAYKAGGHRDWSYRQCQRGGLYHLWAITAALVGEELDLVRWLEKYIRPRGETYADLSYTVPAVLWRYADRAFIPGLPQDLA